MFHADRVLAAQALLAAYSDGHPIEPLTDKYPDITLDDAYTIQRLQLAVRRRAGAAVIGHKVGLTSVAMQEQLGVDRPDFGHLLRDMLHGDGGIPAGRYLQPRIEPEMAFILRSPLRGPGVTAAQAAEAIGAVLPALEIIDSRIRDWRIRFEDTVADNASSGGVVVGHGVPPAALDLKTIGCAMTANGRFVGSGLGSAVLGSPINALAWLANTLGERGTGLGAGQLILPGAVMASVPVAPGDVVSATFTGGLGVVTARFEDLP
jgi:2-keto-4-pentenoate hydratase